MANRTEEIAAFVMTLKRECPNATPYHAMALMKAANRLNKINENGCNGYHTRDAEDRDNRREANLKSMVATVCTEIAAQPIYGSDPRGRALLLRVASGYSSDWGGRGLAVPEIG